MQRIVITILTDDDVDGKSVFLAAKRAVDPESRVLDATYYTKDVTPTATMALLAVDALGGVFWSSPPASGYLGTITRCSASTRSPVFEPCYQADGEGHYRSVQVAAEALRDKAGFGYEHWVFESYYNG